jgi:hypothetical protein
VSTSAPAQSDDVPEYADLLDDAALLEPPSGAGVASLADAVARHRDHASRSPRVRSLVVPDPMLPALLDLPDLLELPDPLVVTVAVGGGAGGIEPAAQWASRSPSLTVATLATTLRDLDDLAGAARRTVAAVEQARGAVPGLEDSLVAVGVPLEHAGQPGWMAALDEIAMADLVVSLRTGDRAAAPEQAVTTAIDAALDREVAVRFTGAHAEVTRGGRHGYRNLVLALRLTLDGEAEEAAALLAETDAAPLDARADELGSDSLVRARRWLPAVEAHLA